MWSIAMIYNTFVVLPVSGLVALYYFPMAPGHALMPWPHWLLFFSVNALVFSILYDFLFYFIHRMFHLPFLFRHFHWVHHTSQLNGDAFHCTALEQVVVNVWPFVYVCHLVNMTWSMFAVWSVIAVLNSGYTHTRAHTNHLVHHTKCHYNFGVAFMFADKLFGTYYSGTA